MNKATQAKLDSQKQIEPKGNMKPEVRFSTEELITLLEVANLILSKDDLFDGFVQYLGLPKKKLKPIQMKLIRYNKHITF
jgi:hypothetical protein